MLRCYPRHSGKNRLSVPCNQRATLLQASALVFQGEPISGALAKSNMIHANTPDAMNLLRGLFHVDDTCLQLRSLVSAPELGLPDLPLGAVGGPAVAVAAR